jgi:hypothetical protein
MHKLKCLHLFAALLAFTGLAVVDARSADLEGALQYPPLSVGQNAQPPPPARMVPQPLTPRRMEMDVSGTSVPADGQRSYIRPSGRLVSPGEPPPTEAGGN